MSEKTIERDRKTRQEPFGTVYEAGRDKRFVASSTNPIGTVHEREKRDNADGYKLDPKCGQTLHGSSVWAGIDAESAEAVAREYGATQFCTKCFARSMKLAEIGRKARQ